MKKVLITVLAIFAFAGIMNAQNKMSIGAGLVVSLPMGDFGDAANTGFGGTAAFEMSFTEQLVGVGNIGYISWGTESDAVSFSAVPVLVGVKYYFTPGVGFYGIGQLGLSFFSTEVEIPGIPFFGIEAQTVSESTSEFTLAVGAGYELPISSNLLLDLTGAFNVISDLNHVTLRAGVKYGL